MHECVQLVVVALGVAARDVGGRLSEGPCRQMEPAFEELAAANPSHKWVKVNVDENPATAARFQILAIPAFVVVEGGEETKRIAGAKPKGRFAAELGLGVPA